MTTLSVNDVVDTARQGRGATASTDTIPRIQIRDLLLAVAFVLRSQNATLDGLRIKLNDDRNASSGGTKGYSVARDVASELRGLGFAEVPALPKDAKGFEKKRQTPIALTELGKELGEKVRTAPGEAYEMILRSFHRAHPYVRRYVAALARGPFVAPVLTSWEQHVSTKYAAAQALVDDVERKQFDLAALLQTTSDRLGRALDASEHDEISQAVAVLLERSRVAAGQEPQTDFARKMLMAVNEIVVPATLRREGLGFDFKTLSRLWSMGREFQTSWSTSAHPRYRGRLTFPTAEFDLSEDGLEVLAVRFENGVRRMGDGFLDKLFRAYALMQEWGQPAIVTAWELRATFCFENGCAPGVFDHLFKENYGGSDVYQIDKDFPRNKPAHEDALVIGGREIGLIRISRKK